MTATLRGGSWLVVAFAAWVALAGCEALKPGTDRRDATGGPDVPSDIAAPDTLDADATVLDDAPLDLVDAPPPDADAGIDATVVCPELAARRRVDVTANLRADTHWTCNNLYVLSGVVFVEPSATLTIDPGTVIEGTSKSGLVVARGARIEASGTSAAPIVFTSSRAVGTRAVADWLGLVVLGNAVVAQPPNTPLNYFPPDPVDGGTDGGVDASTDAARPPDLRVFGGADDDWNCGTLRYVRVEFAGDQLVGSPTPFSSVTLAGCGRGTTVDFVQAQLALDDGFKLLGGTVDARHLIASRIYNNELNYGLGYRGRIQFFAGQHDPTQGSRGISANTSTVAGAMPRSRPTIYNVTLIGPRTFTQVLNAINFRREGYGVVRNALAMGFSGNAINAEGAVCIAAVGTDVIVEYSMFYQFGRDDVTFFTTSADAGVADGGINQVAYFTDPERHNQFGVNPVLPTAYNLVRPGFAPRIDSPVAGAGTAPPADGFFDTSANYIGALPPSGMGPDWTLEWSAYPAN